MITKEQLQAMGDLEINQLLTAYALGNPWLEFGELVNEGKEFHVANAVGEPFYCAVINYCNNWNDIMPLAVKYRVGVEPFFERWKATEQPEDWPRKGKEFACDKPQRAIACCLILLLQDQQ